MNTPRKLALVEVFRADARKLLDARERAKLVHKTGDIDASGDEVEKSLRDLVAAKLPGLSHVGHGHLMDSTHTVSSQLDLIIADHAATPILFKTENGTEYVPFECVFAIGETKTNYTESKKPIHAFSSVIKSIRNELQRERTPTNYLGHGLSLGGGLSTNELRPYKNPLYAFMLFAGGDAFDIAKVVDLYRTEAPEYLPNVVCILDQGLMLNGKFTHLRSGEVKMTSINLIPEFNAPEAESFDRWAFIPYGSATDRAARSFGVLWLLLNQHLRSCILSEPKLNEYLRDWGTFENGLIIDAPAFVPAAIPEVPT